MLISKFHILLYQALSVVVTGEAYIVLSHTRNSVAVEIIFSSAVYVLCNISLVYLIIYILTPRQVACSKTMLAGIL